MSQSDGAAVGVCDTSVEAKLLGNGKELGSEGFVHLSRMVKNTESIEYFSDSLKWTTCHKILVRTPSSGHHASLPRAKVYELTQKKTERSSNVNLVEMWSNRVSGLFSAGLMTSFYAPPPSRDKW